MHDGLAASMSAETVLKVHIDEAGYEPGKPRIHHISFDVVRGQLLGLIGPNGAGKSTTIKALLGLLKNCKAEVSIAGDPPRYAYVPEHPVFYEDLTLWEHLDLAAAAFGMGDQDFEEQATALLRQFDMEKVKHDLPNGFSKGMRQKMMLMIGFWPSPMSISWTSRLSGSTRERPGIFCACWMMNAAGAQGC